VAFSSRQIIQNVIAGILITINRPTRLEVWVIISGRPETGLSRVQDTSLTTTILQELDGRSRTHAKLKHHHIKGHQLLPGRAA